jgi:hypothetical protein
VVVRETGTAGRGRRFCGPISKWHAIVYKITGGSNRSTSCCAAAFQSTLTAPIAVTLDCSSRVLDDIPTDFDQFRIEPVSAAVAGRRARPVVGLDSESDRIPASTVSAFRQEPGGDRPPAGLAMAAGHPRRASAPGHGPQCEPPGSQRLPGETPASPRPLDLSPVQRLDLIHESALAVGR